MGHYTKWLHFYNYKLFVKVAKKIWKGFIWNILVLGIRYVNQLKARNFIEDLMFLKWIGLVSIFLQMEPMRTCQTYLEKVSNAYLDQGWKTCKSNRATFLAGNLKFSTKISNNDWYLHSFLVTLFLYLKCFTHHFLQISEFLQMYSL